MNAIESNAITPFIILAFNAIPCNEIQIQIRLKTSQKNRYKFQLKQKSCIASCWYWLFAMSRAKILREFRIAQCLVGFHTFSAETKWNAPIRNFIFSYFQYAIIFIRCSGLLCQSMMTMAMHKIYKRKPFTDFQIGFFSVRFFFLVQNILHFVLRAVCHWTWFLYVISLCQYLCSVWIPRHRMYWIDIPLALLLLLRFVFGWTVNTENYYEFSMNRQSIWFASGFYRLFCEWFIDCLKSFWSEFSYLAHHNR